jgi:hypothetical protein
MKCQTRSHMRNVTRSNQYLRLIFFNPLKPKLVEIILKSKVRTAKKTQHFTNTKINWFTLFKEIIAVNSKKHMKVIHTHSGQNTKLLNIKAGGTYNYHLALKG